MLINTMMQYLFVDVVVAVWCCIFFFFKQKTEYEMRISDWSSDVCSSDLEISCLAPDQLAQEKRKMLTTQDWNAAAKRLLNNVESGTRELPTNSYEMPVSYYSDADRWNREIGRASCRERVCQYV